MDIQELLQTDLSKELYASADFHDFWQRTKSESDSQPLSPSFEPYPFCEEVADVQRVYFNGFGGGRLEGILLRPRHCKGPAPALIFTHGYSMGNKYISGFLKWLLAGFHVLIVNMRVEIPMRNADLPSCRVPGGIMTRGLEHPDTYIYRYMYADAYRSIQLLRSMEGIDPDRIGIWGASQGSAVAVAVAALDGNIRFLSLLYPYMNHIKSGIEKQVDGPFQEIWRYFRLYDPELTTMPDICKTLSYFDIMHFADRINCPVLVAAGLKDNVCRPQHTVGFYNLLQCEKELKLYHTHGHEDIPAFEDASYLFCIKNSK